jgi:hypothetical protein
MATIRFRDPIHNFISFEGKEVDLINSPALQRLRGIKQLALACLVYPGALHTRFDHTLGVTHVAGQMADLLAPNVDPEEKKLVRWSALLHDIGHGPFSHVSENALDRFAAPDVLPEEQKKDKIHEVITGHLIRNHAAIREILGGQDCERVAKLLTHGYGEPIMRSIVSGPLDSDKQDYLLRDSQFCGVNYGVFDIHQLQRSLTCQTLNHAKELMIRDDGVHAVEQFVLAKYYLTSMVYRHRVRLITDQMITRAIILGIEKDQIEELRGLYRFDNTEAFFENFLGWNDARFLLHFGNDNHAGTKCKGLIDRLTQRKLLKCVFHAPIKEFSAEVREKILDISKPLHAVLRAEIELELAELVQREFNVAVDADYTMLNSFQIKSVRESSRNDEASILVFKPGRNPSQLENESVLFESIDERLSDKFVDVYAPVEWKDRADRSRKLIKLVPLIKEVIQRKIPTLQRQLDL